MDKKAIIIELHRIGAIKLGEFTLASGLISPLYVDLRSIIAYPTLLKAISEQLWSLVKTQSCELVCGVPYTALPIATTVSIIYHVSLVMVRKEPKTYGTKKQIEGVFQPGQSCIVVEDLVTTGGSVTKVADCLIEAGLRIEDIVVVIDRQQGAQKQLEARGYRLHALMTITELLTVLQQAGRFSAFEAQKAQEFLESLPCV